VQNWVRRFAEIKIWHQTVTESKLVVICNEFGSIGFRFHTSVITVIKFRI